jgi:hypothetical protein
MKSLTRKTAWLGAAIAAFAAVTVWADGELDGTFGTNGVVKISFPNSMRGYLHSAQTLAESKPERRAANAARRSAWALQKSSDARCSPARIRATNARSASYTL